MRGKVFADATAELRPASAIQNLIVNIDPGDPGAGPLPEGEPIPAGRTTAFVAIDELTGVLDADTRAYAQILIAELERGLRGRERRPAGSARASSPTSPTTRRRSPARLRRGASCWRGSSTTSTCSRRDPRRPLGGARQRGRGRQRHARGHRRARARAGRGDAPARARSLEEADRSLAAGADLAEILVPALDRLVPASGGLGEASAKLRALLPRAEVLVGQFDGPDRRRGGADAADAPGHARADGQGRAA